MTDGLLDWLSPFFRTPWDWAGFLLFILVFPVYHTVYPWFSNRRPDQTSRGRIDALRKSWIERLIERGDVATAAQQTRNLTMVNSILVSSSLILLGITTNLLIRIPEVDSQLPHLASNLASSSEAALRLKLYLLLLSFVMAFSFCMTALRHLGHFVLVIGADPKLVEGYYGSAADYFSDLINRASHRYTLGVRSFYAAFPLFAWLFDSHLFVLLTLFWGLKFLGFQDFAGRRLKAFRIP